MTISRDSFPATNSRPALTRDPESVARVIPSVARSALEVIRGVRSPSTLSHLVTPEIAAKLARRAALSRRLQGKNARPTRVHAEVTGVRTCVISTHVVEASAVIREPGRARFVAMRWERRHTGWRMTVLEIG